MYLPRSTLILLVITYLLFLLSVDWVAQPEGAWYRPFLIGISIIVVAMWCHREQNADDL